MYIYRVIEYADSKYDTKKIVICIYLFVFCFHVTKSKSISKIIVATCSQGPYRVFESRKCSLHTLIASSL